MVILFWYDVYKHQLWHISRRSGVKLTKCDSHCIFLVNVKQSSKLISKLHLEKIHALHYITFVLSYKTNKCVLSAIRWCCLWRPCRKKVLFKRNSWTAAPSGKVFHYWSSYLCSATAGAASGLGEGIGSLVHSWAGGCSRCSQPSPAGHIQSRLDSRKSSQHWEKYSPPRLGKIQASRSSWLLNWKFLKGWKL